MKVEICRKATENTSVQVEYEIKVSNTGEVSGNATIEENIPEGMSLANNDGTWEEQEGKLVKGNTRARSRRNERIYSIIKLGTN